MDHANATRVADALSRTLPFPVSVELINPHAATGLGYAARVHRPDRVVDVIGDERSGYQIYGRTTGWQPFDALAAELQPTPSDEQSPPDDDDLITRMTELAVLLSQAGAAARAVRDELVLRRNR